MRYSFVILSLALCAFLLAGCAQQQKPDVTDPFIGGTEGIVTSFQQGAPPRQIFDGGSTNSGGAPFSVSLILQNQGEADVGSGAVTPGGTRNGVVLLSGINPVEFSNPAMCRSFNSGQGVTLTRTRKAFDGTRVAGAPDIVTLEGFNYQPTDRGDSQRTIRANVCYDYMTFVDTQVCIKSNLLETLQDNTICTLSGPRDPKNSGAPVHVTSLSQYPLGKNKIQITFTVENVNKGLIFAPSSKAVAPLSVGSLTNSCNFYCDNSLSNPNRNKVWTRVTLSGSNTGNPQCNFGGPGSGTNEGMVTLFSGAPAIVTCTVLAPSGSNLAYTDTLKIDLDYAYGQFIETPVVIKSVTSQQQ